MLKDEIIYFFSPGFRSQGFGLGTARGRCSRLEVLCGCVDDEAVILASPRAVSDGRLPLLRFYHQPHDCSNFFGGRRGLSSQAGAESSGEEDDLEEGFSELETPATADAVQKSMAEDEKEYGLISESELSGDHDDIENDLELSETETEASRKTTPSKRKFSKLFKAIMDAPDISIHSTLTKYAEEGNDLSRAEIALAMANLRTRRMYGKALQVIWHSCIMNFIFIYVMPSIGLFCVQLLIFQAFAILCVDTYRI